MLFVSSAVIVITGATTAQNDVVQGRCQRVIEVDRLTDVIGECGV